MKILRRGLIAMVVALLSRQAVAQSATAPTGDVPLVGIASITFRVSDLDKARRYYQGVLGLTEAFTTSDSAARTTSVFFKINDDQYIEVVSGLAPSVINREARVTFQSTDLNRLHDVYAARGLNPSAINRGLDGNPVFRVIGPDDAALDFVQYAPS